MVTIDVPGTLDGNDIRKKVLTHQEIVAIREGLSMITDPLEEFSEELVLHKFDMIQIYIGGLDILRIVHTESQDGRSVYVGINDYRRNVQRLIYKWRKERAVTISIVITSLLSSALTGYLVCRERTTVQSKLFL